jgi:hypothetical protein
MASRERCSLVSAGISISLTLSPNPLQIVGLLALTNAADGAGYLMK